MIGEPRCFARRCRHLTGTLDTDDELKQVPVCAAFPKGIPDEIAYGDNLHTEPYPGDHGIQYSRAGTITMKPDQSLVVTFEPGGEGDIVTYRKDDPEYDTVLASIAGGIKIGQTKPVPEHLPGDVLDLSDLDDYDDLIELKK